MEECGKLYWAWSFWVLEEDSIMDKHKKEGLAFCAYNERWTMSRNIQAKNVICFYCYDASLKFWQNLNSYIELPLKSGSIFTSRLRHGHEMGKMGKSDLYP